MREALKLALEALTHYVQAGLATLKTIDAIKAIKEALAQQDVRDEIDRGAKTLRETYLAQPEQELEFVTHNVDKPYDWSEWVCPNPSGYLMKCCDCGLVHEAEFGVVRYKSETEREECDMVDDPNVQVVFRMRRSEEWTPKDTAHRAGGLPMAQPEQEPVALQMDVIVVNLVREGINKHRARELAEHFIKHTTPPQRKPLTDEEIGDISKNYALSNPTTPLHFARAIEAAHGIKE